MKIYYYFGHLANILKNKRYAHAWEMEIFFVGLGVCLLLAFDT